MAAVLWGRRGEGGAEFLLTSLPSAGPWWTHAYMSALEDREWGDFEGWGLGGKLK